jgi:FKBP-type peptidyl-prolyl cis-trans isomerase
MGTGDEAVLGKAVVVNVRMFLNHGTEVFTSLCGSKIRINLKRQWCIDGLMRGIEGMRVGGARSIVVSPHLAYGAEGLPGKVPPNALLRCEVELLDVREPHDFRPGDFPPGRHVTVFHPGEAARNLPRWQFGLSEDGRCGAGLYFPIPGMTWRHTRRRESSTQLEPSLVAAVLNDAVNLPIRFPKECLSTDELWADSSEPSNSITRDRASDTLCLTIDVWERGQRNYYSMRENSPALIESELYRIINSLIQPHLVEASAVQSSSRPKGQLPD